MKLKKSIHLIACASAILALPHFVSAQDITLVDYTGQNPAPIPSDSGGFDFGSWSGNIIGGDGFIEIGGIADAAGGLGFGGLSFPDLAGGTATLSLRLGAGNTASTINFMLQGATDQGGSQFLQNGYGINTADLNTSTFTSVVIDLNTPSFVQLSPSGTPSGLAFDFTDVNQWQFQGDFGSGDVNIELQSAFISTAIIPEPHHYALGFGFIAVFATAVVRRRRNTQA